MADDLLRLARLRDGNALAGEVRRQVTQARRGRGAAFFAVLTLYRHAPRGILDYTLRRFLEWAFVVHTQLISRNASFDGCGLGALCMG